MAKDVPSISFTVDITDKLDWAQIRARLQAEKEEEDARAARREWRRQNTIPPVERRRMIRAALWSGMDPAKVRDWALSVGERKTAFEVYLTDWQHEKAVKAHADNH